MRQPYTQSKRSRNLSLPAISGLTETQAYDFLRQIRFADNRGEPYCPHCFGKRVRWRTDKRWLCSPCRRTFSVFSGTVWDSKRKPCKLLLMLAAHFATNSAGDASISIARRTASDPKATYLSMMKMREALALHSMHEVLSGVCEADGCFVGGYKRKLNDRLLEKHLKQTGRWVRPPKKVLCVLRERNGVVLTHVELKESDFLPFIRAHLEQGSQLHVDSASTFEKLQGDYDLRTINHEVRYHDDEASTNSAESFFRRVRRAEKIYVHISSQHLDLYGAELAFRETHCKHSDAEKFLKLLAICFRQPMSRRFKGYYQRGAAKCGRN